MAEVTQSGVVHVCGTFVNSAPWVRGLIGGVGVVASVDAGAGVAMPRAR
jgi:hypothetical protein